MSRISMDLAEKIGQREAEKKFDPLISAADLAFKKHLLECVLKNYPTPPEIQKILKGENASWIRVSGKVSVPQLVTVERYSSAKEFQVEPHPVPSFGDLRLDVTPKIQKLYDQIQTYKEEKKAFSKKIKYALLGLGTVKKILENFPEFSCHLGDKIKITNALVPFQTIKEIRKDIVRP